MKHVKTFEKNLITEKLEVQEKFDFRYDLAKVQLEQIQRKLDQFKIDYNNDSANWGYVGSLSHVNERLDDLLEFLGK